MTVVITHNFVSAKSDGVDNTLVQPSNWGTAATNASNSTHTLTMAGGGNVLGRTAGGTGVPTELTATTQGLAILGAVDLPALIAAGIPVFSTGDAKMTLKTSADTGWVMANDGTIGSATSGATTRANADTSALFQLLWNNCADADCAVVGGRGGSAAADFASNKQINLPKLLGRALAIAGAGSGLTSRALAHVVGEENHLLSTAEMPSHSHTDAGHAHLTLGAPNLSATGISGGAAVYNAASNQTSGIAFASIQNTGGGGTHNNMQPTTFLNFMVKL